MLLLAACGAPDANVECWDGTMAESADLCPPEPAPEPEPEVVERELSDHGEYAQPDARQERREERKAEGEERLNIDINEEADHLEAAKERLGVDSEPLVLEGNAVSSTSDAMDMGDTATGSEEEIVSGDSLDLSALGGEDVMLIDENCESCITTATVEVLERGSNFGFGVVMRYAEGADNNPRFVFNDKNMVELHHVEYGTMLKEYEAKMEDKSDWKLDVTKTTLEINADGDTLIREGGIGPLASGKAFGFYVRDGRVRVSNLEHTNWI